MHKDLAAMFLLRLRLQQYSMNCEFPPRAQANLQKTPDMKMIVRTSKGDFSAAKGPQILVKGPPMNSMSISCHSKKNIRNTENHRKTFPEVVLTEVRTIER